MTSIPSERPAAFTTHRLLPFDPATVYAAFADPARLAAWWGPAGFTNEFEVFEFRPGGRWVFVMQGPDGTRYPNQNEFLELQPAARVVIRHVSAPRFVLTVELAARAGGTELHWSQSFDEAEVAARVKAIVVPANEQNLDRLQRLLAGQGAA
jgi:uncharacterized protein YndB with AHSA1/START domain